MSESAEFRAPLTPAQLDALRVLHKAGRDGCWPTSRASKGRGVNSRAADSLRRQGLARVELTATGEQVSITAAGCAALSEADPNAH